MGGGGDAFDFVGLGEKGKEGEKTGGGGGSILVADQEE